MGHLLDALKQINDLGAPPVATGVSASLLPGIREAFQPGTPEETPKPRLARTPTPLDPRYREVFGAIQSYVTARDGASILVAGFAVDERRAGQLASLYSLLGPHIDGNVLVVDADTRGSALPERLKSKPGQGVADVLAGRTIWRKAIQKTLDDSLYFLSLGDFSANRSPIALEDFSRLLTDLRTAYRVVIVDLLLPTAREMGEWASVCDTTVLTARLGATPRSQVQEAIRAIRARGGQVLGCVLLDA